MLSQREARERAQTAYAEGVEAARKRVEQAEHALDQSRRAEAAASEKARIAIAALAEYRDKTKAGIERLMKTVGEEHALREAEVTAARRAEAIAVSRLSAETARREAAFEEDRARLRAEFEEARARLEDEMDAERRAVRERWHEQAQALEGLRKEIERGRQGA